MGAFRRLGGRLGTSGDLSRLNGSCLHLHSLGAWWCCARPAEPIWREQHLLGILVLYAFLEIVSHHPCNRVRESVTERGVVCEIKVCENHAANRVSGIVPVCHVFAGRMP